MKTLLAIAGQTLLDIAIHSCGDVRGVLALAASNNMSITGVLSPATAVVYTPGDYYKENATGLLVSTAPEAEPELNVGDLFEPVTATHVNLNTMAVAVEGQTLLDIATQERGGAPAVVELLTANQVSITTTLTPGQKIVKPTAYYNREVVRYFAGTGHKPATASALSEQIQYLFEAGLFEFGLFE